MTSEVVKEVRGRIKQKEWLYETKASLEAGQMTDELADMLTALVKRFANHPNYCRFTYNEDMQAHAMMALCKSWQHFNPEKSDNAFAYYVTVIKCAFANFQGKERKQRDVKEDYKNYIDTEQHF